MREFKFRVWDKTNKQWVKEFVVSPNGQVGVFMVATVDVHNLALMQYTGRKDRNGEEIYEGDVLKGMGVVEWVEKEARFGINILGELGEVQFWELEKEDMEVIGNIRENPFC